MKIIILTLVLFITSCASNKYVAKRDSGNFQNLKAGEKYVFLHEKDLKTSMEITSIEKDSIIGLENKNRIALAKNTIWSVKRNNTAGTVILVGSSVGTMVLIGVLISKFLDEVAKVGDAIGGQ